MCFSFRRFVFTSLAAGLLVAGTVACSIKEDRRFCPSYVTFEGVGERPGALEGDMAFMGYRGDSLLFLRWLPLDEFYSGGVVVDVGRTVVGFAGVAGWSRDCIFDDRLVIPYGNGCPDAFAFTERTLIDDDIFYFPETLRTLSARVYVRLVGVGEDYPYTLVAEGDVNGYRLAGLEPSQGPFACIPEMISFEDRFCRVPRQGNSQGLRLGLFSDHPLLLPDDVWFGTKAAGKKAVEVFSLPLGVILSEGGYNWYADELPDIHVTIDYAGLSVTIRVNDWTRVLIMDAGGHYTI